MFTSTLEGNKTTSSG